MESEKIQTEVENNKTEEVILTDKRESKELTIDAETIDGIFLILFGFNIGMLVSMIIRLIF